MDSGYTFDVVAGALMIIRLFMPEITNLLSSLIKTGINTE